MAATDDFASFKGGLESPIRRGFDISPHDTNEVSHITRAIHIGVGGDVKVTTVDGDTFVLKNCVSGDRYPVMARIIWSTGTTATNLVGLY